MTKSSDEELKSLNKQIEEAKKKNEILKKKKQLEKFQKQNDELEKSIQVTNTNATEPPVSKVVTTENSLVEEFEKAISKGEIESVKELAKNPGFTVEQRLDLINSVERILPNDRKNREEIKEILRDNIDFTKEKSAPSQELEIRILKQPYPLIQKYLDPKTNPNLKLTPPIVYALTNERAFESRFGRNVGVLPSDRLLSQVFEVEEFVADPTILQALKSKRDYLDKYVDKIIKQDPQNKNLNLQDDAFCKYDEKGKYTNIISIGEYQEKRNAFQKAVGEENFEDIKKIMGNPLHPKKYEYFLREAKEQNKMNLFAQVASDYIDYFKGKPNKINEYDVGRIQNISRILDLGKQEDVFGNAKIFAEILHKKGITKKMIHNAAGKSDSVWRTIETLGKYEPYFELKDWINKFDKIDKTNTKELDKVQKQIDVSVEKMVKAKSPVSLIEEVAAGIKDEKQKQKLLMDYAKASIIPIPKYRWIGINRYEVDPQKLANFVEKNLLTHDKVKNAEIILELTKSLKFDKEDDKAMLAVFEKLYDQKVRSPNLPELPELDKMFEKLPPKDLGKLLFRETYKEDSVKDLHKKSSIKDLIHDVDHGKLDKALALLQASTQKKVADLPPLTDEQKQDAAKNLVSNLSFKQMSKVVEAVYGHEDYSKKNWLSKTLTRFVDGICSRFSKLKTAGVENGVKELMEKGAGVKIDVNKEQKKINVVAKDNSVRL